MKKNIILVLVALAMVALASVARSEEYVKEKQLSERVKTYTFGRTGLIGPTYRGVAIVVEPEKKPDILRLQEGESEKTWEKITFSRCPDKREDGTYKQTYFVGEKESNRSRQAYKDVPNPAAGQPPIVIQDGAKGTGVVQDWGGRLLGNAPNPFPMNRINIKGGNMQQGQGQASINSNRLLGINNNSTKIGIDNKAISGSASAADANAGTGKGH
jgi:hypothetical protein